MIDILHHGATTGVTGSCHELTLTPGMNKGSDPAGSDPNFMPSSSAGILIDCGLFQGQDEGRGASASDLSIDFPIGHIRALIVTHVHIDHVGRRRSRPGTDEKIKMLLATESTEGHGKIKAKE